MTARSTQSRTISLGMLLLLLSCAPHGSSDPLAHSVWDHGGIVRLDTTRKTIYLVFTGHEFAEGGDHVRETLRSKGVRAAFFFTGDFYRASAFEGLIRSLKEGGHYLGAHSDKHLLYAPWEDRDSTLVTYDEWWEDVRRNYEEMERFGIRFADAPFFMPPYEWYNDTIAAWTDAKGLRVINFTPGTITNADYTIPSMGSRYRTSDSIQARLFYVEEREGLNGHILLFHLGTHPERTDKFYARLGPVIDTLRARGYSFAALTDLHE